MIGGAGSASVAGAATLSQSASAPTTNILVSQLSFHPDYTNDAVKDGGRDFTDNSGPVGQTFTVGSNAQIQAITVHGNRDLGELNPQQNFHIRIGSVNTSTRAITTLRDEVAPENVASDDDYLTFSLASPLSVSAGTLYSFSVYSEVGWYGWAHSASDVYANGAPFNSNTSTANNGNNTDGLGKNAGFGTFAAPSPNAYDYVFAIQGTVPEPASLAALMLGGVAVCARRRR
jgi:hypothetical protein